MNYDKIGKFILERRKVKNLTQKELAEKIGVTDKAISKWERGQGCPDVSILEILSKELDCSILELLKGREIENEVIPITEADDYIKDSIAFSHSSYKEKVRIILSRIIEVGILMIVVGLIYLNIIQFLYVEKEYEQKYPRDRYKVITEQLEIADRNISIIKSKQGNFSDEDYKEIVTNLEEYYNSINNLKIVESLKAKETFTYTINDIFVLGLSDYSYLYELYTLKTLMKYDNSNSLKIYSDVAIYSSFSNQTGSRLARSIPLLSYKYRLSLKENDFYGNDIVPRIDELYYLYVDVQNSLYKLIYLTELTMEVGDINE